MRTTYYHSTEEIFFRGWDTLIDVDSWKAAIPNRIKVGHKVLIRFRGLIAMGSWKKRCRTKSGSEIQSSHVAKEQRGRNLKKQKSDDGDHSDRGQNSYLPQVVPEVGGTSGVTRISSP